MKKIIKSGLFLSRKPSDRKLRRDRRDYEEDYDREYDDRDDRRYDDYDDDYDRDYDDDRDYVDDYDDDYDRDYDDDRDYEEDDYDRDYDDRDYEDEYDRDYDDSDRDFEEDEYDREYDDDRDYEDDDYDRDYDDRDYADDDREYARKDDRADDGYVEYDFDKEFARADKEFEDVDDEYEDEYEDDYDDSDRDYEEDEYDRDYDDSDRDYEDDEYDDYEYDGGFDDRYDDEEFGRGHKASLKGGYTDRRHPNRRAEDREGNKIVAFMGKAGEFIKNTTPVERVAAVVAVFIFAGAIATGIFYSSAMGKSSQISSFADVGATVEDVEIVGHSGLIAVADAEKAKAMTAEIVEEEEEEEEEEPENQEASVSLNLTSIKGDLKMKFINGNTKKLVSNVPFKVSVVTPDGSTVSYEDDDRDGIIYKKDLKPGKYKVTPSELPGDYSNYKLDTTPKSVEVKDKVEMKPVDVSNEVKKESQVNAAKEDTAVKTVVESTLKDTVEYVESEKIPLDGSDTDGSGTYKEIGKDKIPNPTQTSKIDFASFRTVALLTTADPAGTGSSEKTDAGNNASTEAPKKEENNDNGQSGSGNDNGNNNGNNNDNPSQGGQNNGQGQSGGNGSGNTGNNDNPSQGGQNSGQGQNGGNGTGNTGNEKPKDEKPKEEAPKKVAVNEISISIKAGTTKTIEAKAGSETVTFSSNNDCVSVSGNTIKAEKEGTAKITVSAKGYESAEITVNVTKPDDKIFSVSNNNVELKVGDTCTVAGVDPKLPGYSIALANSADNGLVELSGNTIKALKECNRTIDIKISATGYKTFTFTIKKINPTAASDLKAKLKISKITLVESESLEVKADVEGLSGKSKNSDIAAVSGNKITAKKAGTTTIEFTAKGYNTATVEVKVMGRKDLLKLQDGTQVYIKGSDGKFREATYSDYYNKEKFYLQEKGEGKFKYKGWQTINGKTYYYTKDGEYVTGEQVIQGAKYVFGSDGVLSSSSGGRGIDVSKWNGNIDWKAVKNEGIEFVIIRCGYRGSSAGALIEDPNFKTNIKGAQAAGLKVGVYFFTQAVNEAEAVEEASMVIGLCKGYGITYPVYLDVEGSNGRGDNISAAQRTANIRAFCGTIQNAGYRPGVYANKTWFTSKINTSQLTSYKIWLAQYAASPSYTASRYDMWQYTSKGKVAGISGNVDLNISYR